MISDIVTLFMYVNCAFRLPFIFPTSEIELTWYGTSIVRLLSKEFIILVAISNLIAWPLAYYGAKKWLQNFAYHIDLSWLYFIISGLLVLFITITVVSFQSLKVAITNPVDSLRYE